MKVGIDVRMSSSSGIGRFIRNLLQHLLTEDNELFLTLVGCESLAAELRLPADRIALQRFGAPIYSVREQVEGAIVLSRLRADGLFFPHYNVPVLVRRPYVATIHDLTHLKYPALFGWVRTLGARTLMRQVVSRARRIVTVSNATKDDIESFFPEALGKITIVPNAVDPVFTQPSDADVASLLSSRGLPRRYVLTVGNRKPNKNLATAARVIRELRRVDSNVAWIVVGRRFANYDDVDRSRASLGDGLIELPSVSDEELRLLYGGSLALLMPSLWEGFGLPVIEAMACGTPVVASNIPPFAEVARGGAILCEPLDVAGMALALRSVSNDQRARSELVSKGKKVSACYDWPSSARLLRDVFLEEFGH